MRSSLLVCITAASAALVSPIAVRADPSYDTSCDARSQSTTDQRIADEAARGLPSLIGFVNRTKSIYLLDLREAVDRLDAMRERQAQCMAASAQAPAVVLAPIASR